MSYRTCTNGMTFDYASIFGKITGVLGTHWVVTEVTIMHKICLKVKL